jgi:hypothetical protein
MNVPFAVVYVEHTPGDRLSNGDPAGTGSKAVHRVALTRDGIQWTPVGPEFGDPRKACRYADRVEVEAQQ